MTLTELSIADLKALWEFVNLEPLFLDSGMERVRLQTAIRDELERRARELMPTP